ncbi:MAG: hypothetical protein M1820_006946 [Bogoriella megaspora]|nr:MAG: hypothetical protein M1820_006946 [Bogoriella megaspora]
MKSTALLFLSFTSLTISSPAGHVVHRRQSSGAPTATTKNGTYVGVHSSPYNQDYFLGIPFAEPPLQDLRFRNPVSLNESWTETRPATRYAEECIGYGGDQIGYEESEDCLYLNVVRPSGYENESLPVAVWIHGGGFYQGGTPDLRYNLSFIVQNSVSINKPIIGMSIAYRLGPFGFLASNEVQASGQTNIGLRDQHLALQWIQENIAGFGGDPSKVTIWGESAGAASVGFHLTLYNGRDDKLFRAGIMESGNPVSYRGLSNASFFQDQYLDVVNSVGCGDTADSLECLRQVPFEPLNAALNNSDYTWFPYLDGDLNQRYGSQQLADGSFIKVPIISGANSDEGTSFSPKNVNTVDDLIEDMTNPNITSVSIPASYVPSLLDAYPDIPSEGIPSAAEGLGNITLPAPYGAEFRRSAAYFGDAVFIAARRYTCETWAANNLTAYCYRFNAIPAGIPWPVDVTHFQEVAFVFDNINGLGYATNPFRDKGESYSKLAGLMSRSWASFVYDGQVDGWVGRDGFAFGNQTTVESWPKYELESPRDIVWDVNRTSFVEPDTLRAEGIKLINQYAEAYRR